jgi:hypothetical protein
MGTYIPTTNAAANGADRSTYGSANGCTRAWGTQRSDAGSKYRPCF